jgi:hypothetical protein
MGWAFGGWKESDWISWARHERGPEQGGKDSTDRDIYVPGSGEGIVALQHIRGIKPHDRGLKLRQI